MIYEKFQRVKAINIEPLGHNTIAPPLNLNEEYYIKDIILDSAGNQHLNVGLVSTYNYISSVETGEQLPNGNKIHWCHPSRFELVNYQK